MSKSDTVGQERTGPHATAASHIANPEANRGYRPAYFVLGRARDCEYVADIRTETVHVIADSGARVHRYRLDGKTLDEFVAAVGSVVGWDQQLYGGGIAGVVERAGVAP